MKKHRVIYPVQDWNGNGASESAGFGKIGHGDVSSWARGTTKPVLPRDIKTRNELQPIRSMRNIKPINPLPAKPHNPASTVIPYKNKEESVAKAIESCEKTAAHILKCVNLGMFFDNFYASKVVSRAEIKVEPEAKPVLEDVPSTSPEVIAKLSEKNAEMPREL